VSAPEPKQPTKLCPILTANDLTPNTCLKEQCQLYIKLQKPIMHQTGKTRYPDPQTFQYYEGCGLIHTIPWELVKLEPLPQTPEDKQAQEAYKKLETKKAKEAT
jgi:hypothetical protein